MSDCPICEKHRGQGSLVGEVLYEDADVVASHAPVEGETYLGYVFVETKRHARGLAELTDAEACAVALVVSRLANALESEGAENVLALVFNHVPHHHVHVVARYPGTPQEYRGLRITEWAEAPRGGKVEVASLCQRLRAALSDR